ncbi:MAG: hypothetical protein ACAI25_15445 [Planctomycetota bacterium]
MTKEYSADGVKWLRGMEQIRLRPAMYIGGRGSSGLHQLVTILLDDVLSEALEGRCKKLTLTLNADGSICAEDEGRGISIEPHKQSGRSVLESVFTFGASRIERHNGVRRSLFGMNVSLITALSESLVVETTDAGERYRMRFARGITEGELERLGPTKTSGTLIRFVPDRTIFESTARLDQTQLVEELSGLAGLIPGLALGLVDSRTSTPFAVSFSCPRGLTDLVQVIAETPQLGTPIAIESDGVRIAIQVDGSETERFVGFASYHRADVGTHIEGLTEGLDRGFKDAARALGLDDEVATRPRGLRVVVAIDIPYPYFEGLERERLANPDARDLVARVARTGVLSWARDNAVEARALLISRVSGSCGLLGPLHPGGPETPCR